MRKTKTYGLYNVKEYEQCEYFGTQKEISDYLGISINTLRIYLCRKRKGKQKLILNKYDVVEMEEINE